MKKLIFRVLLKVVSLALACGLFAAIIWYFLNERAAVEFSAVLFGCGIGLIALGVIVFGGHSDVSLAPRDYSTAEAIDPKDMAYGKALLDIGHSALLIIVLAGSVVLAVSLLITDWS